MEGLIGRARTPEKKAELEAELEGVPLPIGAAYLWRIFNRLHGRRAPGAFGVSAITWGDIDAFSRLSGVRLTPWEVEQIEAMDAAFVAECGKRSKKDATKGG